MRRAWFSGDGRRVVTASDDGTAKIWDSATGSVLHSLRSGAGGVLDARFSPSGDRVVTGGEDGAIRVWTTSTGALLETIEGHRSPVYFVRFTSDGEGIISASDDATACVWNSSSGARVLTQEAPPGRVFDATGSMNSIRFARLAGAPTTDRALLIDERTGEVLRLLDGHAGGVIAADFDPSGGIVATASGDGTVLLWRVPHGERLHRLQGHGRTVTRITFSSDGRFVICLCGNNTSAGIAHVWDLVSGSRRQVIQDAADAVISSDQKWVLSAGRDGAQAQRMASTAPTKRFAQSSGHTDRLAISPDGTRVVTCSRNQWPEVWDFDSAKKLLDLTSARPWRYTSATFSPSGELLAICGEVAASVRGETSWVCCVYDATSFQELLTVSDLPGRSDVCFNADESAIVVTRNGGLLDSLPVDPVGVARQRLVHFLTTEQLREFRITGEPFGDTPGYKAVGESHR